jgi:hypothetical protein
MTMSMYKILRQGGRHDLTFSKGSQGAKVVRVVWVDINIKSGDHCERNASHRRSSSRLSKEMKGILKRDSFSLLKMFFVEVPSNVKQ